jgi:hypothetical protein
VKPPAAPVIETVAVKAIELPADAIIVTEVEETEVRKASWQSLCDLSATLGKNYVFPSRDRLTALAVGRTMLPLLVEAAMTFRNFSPGGSIFPAIFSWSEDRAKELPRPTGDSAQTLNALNNK